MAMSTVLEKRILIGANCGAVIGVALMLISISTDYWVTVTIPWPGGFYVNRTESWILGHHSGLWRICRTELDKKYNPVVQREYCSMIKLFPSKEEVVKDPEVDMTILNYSRTETAFAVLSLPVMVLAITFSLYSLRNPRYMFKRLAAMMHFITAACILVSVEVLNNSVSYEQQNLRSRHPFGAVYSFGFSFILAWIVFVIYLIIGIVFLLCSRKRKGEKAKTEEEAMENEPVILS